MLTVALPSSITKKPIPVLPWAVIASPSSKLRSCMRLASFFSSFGFTPWKRGTIAQRFHHVCHGANPTSH